MSDALPGEVLMNRREQLLTALEMEADLYDFQHEVDTNWGARAGEFYTDDAVFEIGRVKMEGRAAIERFYTWRRERGTRTAVHTVSNYRASFDGEGAATATWYMLIYAADAEPVQPTRPPVAINRVTDHLEYDAERNRWLCRRRVLEKLFQGGAMLSLPNFNSKRGSAQWAAQSLIPMPI
jgi:hypothetical protein